MKQLSKPTIHKLCRYGAIGYIAAWVIGLSAGGPSVALDASTAKIVHEFSRLQTQATVQFLFAEGVAGLLLALVVATAVRSRAATQASAEIRKLFQLTGLAAANLSILMCVFGVVLILHIVPGGTPEQAHQLYGTINRIDGPKMWLLALMALYGVRMVPTLPRWLKVTGYTLAAALVVSGISYALLAQNIAWTVYISGILLLVWVGGFGWVVGRPPVGAKHKA